MSSKLALLQPFRAPPPEPKPTCAACKFFSPECLVPIGEAAVPTCWLCAHHIVEHGASLESAVGAECECMPHQIYPNRTILITHDEVFVECKISSPASPRERDRAKLLKQSPEKLAAWAREAHKQMSNEQLAAVKKRLS